MMVSAGETDSGTHIELTVAGSARSEQRSSLRRVGQALRAEPLLLFLLIGVLLVGLGEGLSPRDAPGRDSAGEIDVSSAQISAMREFWRERNGREPDAKELDAIVEDYLDTEVLYREARSLGLDVGDLVVRRRLAQNMRFIIEGTSAVPPATEQELARYLDAHRDRYDGPPRWRLSHVFVSADRHADARAAARELRERLVRQGLEPEAAVALSDPWHAGYDLPALTAERLERTFGPAFVVSLESLPAAQWSEPVSSSYGAHLVWLHERLPRVPAMLDEVRERVLADFTRERRAQATTERLASLRARYSVRVDYGTSPDGARTARARLER